MRENRFSSIRLTVVALGISVLMFISGSTFSHAQTVDALHPESKQSISSKKIAQLLRQYHFDHKRIDDDVSTEMLDLFISRYDRNHMYFLASDIENFEQFRYTLDDDVRTGKLEDAFVIFNTLKTRVAQRMLYIEQRLRLEFNFDLEEDFQLDRSEAEWATSTEELDELWRKKLKNEALNLKLAGKEWDAAAKTLTKRYSNLTKRIDQYQSEDVFQDFINALAETFDPHTSYFSPISSDNFGIDMSLSLEGIGAQLTTEDDYTKIVRIIPGGPADRSKKLWANDKIIGVGEGSEGEMIDVIGMRLDDVVQKIRGHKGSKVRLEILAADNPPGSPSEQIMLTRDKVILEERASKSDTVEFLHDGQSYKLGIIDIPTFYIDLDAQRRGVPNYKSTTRDVKRLIRELQGAGVDGIIIDLRRNGGGSLQEAIELTGLFIEDGPVVQVKSSIGSKRVENDPDPDLFYGGPLAVMVDRFSASASEIFASAIQDYGRGLILGSQTYGKGTVQNLIGLERFIRPHNGDRYGQLKVTIAKFYRITGGTTQHRGVIPDINFPSVYNEMDFGENKQIHALPWDEISPAVFKSYDEVSMFLSKLRLNSKKRTSKNEEFQYIREDIQAYLADKEKNSISLKESDRAAQRKKLEERDLLRANERRAKKELEPLKKGDKIPQDDRAPDAILDESELVMADFISLMNPDRSTEIAKRQNGGEVSKQATPGTVKIRQEEKLEN